MEVKNKIMYHISRENKWNIEDVIRAGTHENPFWSFCKNYTQNIMLNGQVISLFDLFKQECSLDVTKNNIDFLYQNLKTVSKETAFCIREYVFEEVRKEFYSYLPSRQKCLWLCEEEQIAYWRTLRENESQYLLKLQINGEIFCGDDRWLTANTFSSVEYAKRAKQYWGGEMSDSPRKEYLFYGKAVVKEITVI